ncbi:MAG: uncharacterized membrane protein YheB (UPF0754 family) [Lysobacterales bacterium]|jgi:uncharacterized membrane protein YheB (UPF0754 family)
MSLLTNIIAGIIIFIGYLSPVYSDQLLSIGFFALSGAVTNWLAIHMLFEKVPFLYGSGVIPSRFEEFKEGIKQLIMTQFFTDENVDKFFQGQTDSTVAHMNFEPVINVIDYNEMFNELLVVVKESTFGSMLSMVGGTAALEPMRMPFKERMRAKVLEISQSSDFRKALEDNILPSNLSKDVVSKVEEIVNARLNELTPQMVKDIIQDMIRKHLGWLVVWGGVFGGLIGLAMSFVR